MLDALSTMKLSVLIIGSGSQGKELKSKYNSLISSIDWKDNRVSYQDFIAAKKEGKFPTGLPILKLVNGREITQSCAILRYAGKLCGLYPEDPLKAMVCDSILDNDYEDFMGKIYSPSEVFVKQNVAKLLHLSSGGFQNHLFQLLQT